ncbi:extracellular solute-binding protein [Prosthecomicrobium sp. N25]|uniref:extracellular solute-binding protein n=1 Tax=Prosthecomicrobium sp. N25 TaxID=3129254 RepID=UPI003FCD975F
MPAAAQGEGERHGLSYFGDLKYPADFRHFDYVNPAAPKGGRLVTVPSQWAFNQNPSTFNSLNTLILRGDAAVGLEGTFSALMVRGLDEPDAVYGLVARSVSIRDGGNSYVFRLRPEARFHDGSPISAEDVAFSLNTLKEKGHPAISLTIREMAGAEATGWDTVVVRFTGRQSRGLPLVVATLPIVSKAYYATRPFDQTTMEPPLGSGPYRVGRFEAGRYIEYERVADWWGRDLPVSVGQNNFDVIRYEMFRERNVAFEAFKAGQYLLREEFTSLTWATQYDFPAIAEKKVVRFELEDQSPSGRQGWYLNTRREKFADPRVREALGLAFDFEWTNKNVFFGSYTRVHSFFVNTEYEATGTPSSAELALLEPYRGKVSDEVFGEAWRAPVSDGSGRDRATLRRASQLLAEAGWTLQNGALRNRRGEALTMEFLDSDTSFQRVVGPFQENLKRIGVDSTSRIVDPSQYQKRIDEFDFDVVSRRTSMAPTPEESMREAWSSATADKPGSANLPGIKDPVVDALVDKALAATTREDLVTICRALDRVLRSGRYWIPHWYKGSHWIAMWDVYARPAVKPRYSRGIQNTWWVDRDKAAALGKGL